MREEYVKPVQQQQEQGKTTWPGKDFDIIVEDEAVARADYMTGLGKAYKKTENSQREASSIYSSTSSSSTSSESEEDDEERVNFRKLKLHRKCPKKKKVGHYCFRNRTINQINFGTEQSVESVCVTDCCDISKRKKI